MGKQKITKTFERLKQNNNKAFIAYIMAGDGGLDQLKEQILSLQTQGVDIIELGIPFSDPVADGPVIQEAGQRAISEDVTLSSILEKLIEIKNDIHIPVILMGYLNPIFHMGLPYFTQLAQKANISGVILPDVPFEEEPAIKEELDKADIAMIRLVTLTSNNKRLQQLSESAEGFIYAVTVKGTTGERSEYSNETYDYLNRLSDISPVPVCAGFGISSKELATTIGKHCDGVIVGSKIVNYLHEGELQKISDLIPDKFETPIK